MNFRDFLIGRAQQNKTRRWLRRAPVHDLCSDFAADCELHPERVPEDDGDLYAYLERRVGKIALNGSSTHLDSRGNAIFPSTCLEYLWTQYLRTRT